MTSVIGMAVMAGLVLFIWLLARGRRQRESNAMDFFSRSGLVRAQVPPRAVMECFSGAQVAGCYSGSLSSGIPFHWWTWYTQERTGSVTAFVYRVTIAVAGSAISEESKHAALAAAANHKDGLLEREYRTPVNARALSDGTFLITWRTDIGEAQRYAAILEWLELHLKQPAAPPAPPPFIPTGEYRAFLEGLGEQDRSHVGWLLQFVDAFEQDYHDTKGHPVSSLEDHAKLMGAGATEVAMARQSLKLTLDFELGQLAEEGLRIEEIEKAKPHQRTAMCHQLRPPGMDLLYLPYFRIVVDRQSRTAYRR